MTRADIINICSVVVALCSAIIAFLTYAHVQPKEEKNVEVQLRSVEYKIERFHETQPPNYVFHVMENIKITNKSDRPAQIRILPGAYGGFASVDGRDLKQDDLIVETYKPIVVHIDDIAPLDDITVRVLNEVEKDGPKSINAALRMIGLRHDENVLSQAIGTLNCSKDFDARPAGRLSNGLIRTIFTIDVERTRLYCEVQVAPI